MSEIDAFDEMESGVAVDDGFIDHLQDENRRLRADNAMLVEALKALVEAGEAGILWDSAADRDYAESITFKKAQEALTKVKQ